jgi:putative Ca2+/H+ antiporter (TMEM165/GDT1 family)
VASFAVLFVAEWGDLSQLLTAGLVARGGHPVAVFAGSWAGLAVISAAAVLLGRVLMRYVSLAVVQYVGAGVCTVLAILTTVSAFT